VYFKAIFLAFYCVSSFASGHHQNLRKIAYSKPWLNLLHYQKTLLDSYKSTIDDGNFFLSNDGRVNPLHELKKTIKILENNTIKLGHFKQLPRCVYKQREYFLKNKKIIQSKKINCSDFQNWKNSIGNSDLSIIFSSYYPNNPASMFGHTMLRFGKSDTKNNLLDYSVAYEAYVPPKTNSLMYTFYGVFGEFKGNLNIKPYYQNVNRYNNFENRDIYEYKLNFTKKQTDSILRHIWELYSTTNSSYYFLDRNCTFFLAEILQIVDERLDLTKGNLIYYHPTRLLMNLKKYNVIGKNIEFRPSKRRKLVYEINQLNQNELEQYKNIVKHKINKFNSKKVINAALSYLNFKKLQKKLKLNRQDNLLYQKLLTQRSLLKNDNSYVDFKKIKKTYPESSRGLSKVRLSLDLDNHKKSLQNFEYSLTSVDFVGSSIGLPTNSKLISLNIKLTKFSNNLRITKFKLIEIESLSPQTILDFPWSWKILVQLKEDLFTNNNNFEIEAGVGKTLGNENNFVSLLLGPTLIFSKAVNKKNFLGYFIKPIFVYSFLKNFRSNTFIKYVGLGELNSELKIKNTSSYNLSLNSNIYLSLSSISKIKTKNKIDRISIGYNYHF